MRAAVRKEAKRQRRSMSWMMRDIFDQWFLRLTCPPADMTRGKVEPASADQEAEKPDEDRV
jgi:hypothetical protein